MLQGDRLRDIEKILSQIWEEMEMGYVDDTQTFLQTAVYCQVNINRIVYMGNKYAEKELHKEAGATIFCKEYDNEPVPNKYIKAIDTATKMLRCPSCRCQIQAYPFSYAVGTRGYSFCPYCGEDLRIENHETEKADRRSMETTISNI